MSALRELSLEYNAREQDWDFLSRLLWVWIIRNGERKVTLKVWFLRKTVQIKDLHTVFELLLGTKPKDVS